MNCGKHLSGGEKESFFLAYTQEQLDVWNRIAEKLRESVSPVSYDAWIKPMRLFAVTSDEIIITSPILQAMGALRGRYESMIEAAVRVNYGMNYRLKLIDPKDAPKEVVTNDTTLNPKYQFENFVVGKANNLAYAAHGSNVVMNMARGKVIYKNGEFLTIDIERVKKEVEGYALPLLFG